MAKGSKHISLRLQPELLAAIELAVRRANHYATTQGPHEPYALRSWVKRAIEEKLEHLARAHKQRRRRSRSGRCKSDLHRTEVAGGSMVASANDTRDVCEAAA